jgi:hypothetical protein
MARYGMRVIIRDRNSKEGVEERATANGEAHRGGFKGVIWAIPKLIAFDEDREHSNLFLPFVSFSIPSFVFLFPFIFSLLPFSYSIRCFLLIPSPYKYSKGNLA